MFNDDYSTLLILTSDTWMPIAIAGEVYMGTIV
jgi:hypothetical protein